MFDPVTLGVAALGKGAMAIRSQSQASNAAKAESRYQQDLLDRRQTDERNAQRENASRLLEDKTRAIERVKLDQAGSGFATNIGTPLAVLGEIDERYSEQVDNTLQSQENNIAALGHQSRLIGYQRTQNQKLAKLNMWSTAFGTGLNAAKGYDYGHNKTGKDPFNIFK